jgi:hypothetical protein
MSAKINSTSTLKQDSEFTLALGWLSAAAVSIVSFAGLA